MTTKLQNYIQMAGQTASQVTQNTENWVSFLNTASRLYRYPFPDQLMIHAQRPKATACAEYDLWNRRMSRYVRRGSKGIGLVGISRSGYPKLRYVFDIADTGKRNEASNLFQWQYKEEYCDIVTKALEERFGVSGEKGFVYQIGLLSVGLANGYWKKHSMDIMHECEGSRLEGLEEQEASLKFRLAAAASISYVLLFRCGFDPWQFLKSKDFQYIPDFNTQRIIKILGAAVSHSSEKVLRTVAVAIYNHEHRRKTDQDPFRSAQTHNNGRDRQPSKDSVKKPEPVPSETVQKDDRKESETASAETLQKDDIKEPETAFVETLHEDERKESKPVTAEAMDTKKAEQLAPVTVEAVQEEEPEPVTVKIPDTEPTVFTETEIVQDKSDLQEMPAPCNFIITDDRLGEGGPKAKFGMNMEAIAILKQIESENRPATPDEQQALSKYVGWGGIPDAFEPDKAGWEKEYQELKAALTPEEYDSAKSSVLNAHYTSPVVIKAIYGAVSGMGFKSGNILEPSCAIGNFFGLLPEEMSESKLYGVELDSISGRIAKLLYPNARIRISGYEKTSFPKDFFDLAIGNVPFGQYQVNDSEYNHLKFSIHNYFIAKSLDMVHPGGILAFITTRYTMDSQNTDVREYLAKKADLLGAIRLPNNAFKANANTEVVSDILFLQKRDVPADEASEWVQTGTNAEGFTVNRYFLSHPEMVLGKESSESSQYGRQEYTVKPIAGTDLATQLQEAVESIHGTYQAAMPTEAGETAPSDIIQVDDSVKKYSFIMLNGELYYCGSSTMDKAGLNKTTDNRVRGMIVLRDCVHSLIALQMDEYTPESAIKTKQMELNRLYDAFTRKYGLINSRANRLAFDKDSSYYLLCSLEILDENGKLERKADMFTKRTIKQHKAVTSVDTASEALVVSIGERARVDLPFMSRLAGKTESELIQELSGVIYKDPVNNTWQTADEYLSGNVRRKLRQAQRAASEDPAYQVNVEALKAAQPKDLDASEIEVRLGATWIDQSYIQQFMYETLNTPVYLRNKITVIYSKFTAEWCIANKNAAPSNDVAAYATYGTERANAYKILEDSLNLRDVRIYDTVEDAEGKEKRVLNPKQTTLAQQKQQALKEAFKDWIFKDPERRQTLVHHYNETMNNTRPREYDGSHIVFSGINPEIKLQPHQVNAIAHVLYGGNTLLAHEVGAGKTFEMIAAAMESKRLGLCHKSIFVVPNHLTEQTAAEFLRLYPAANILVTTKKDFETSNRKKFCARIATSDIDAVIIGHSQFERIPISTERQERLLQEQIQEITAGIAEVKASNGERFTVKQLERTKKSLEARLEKLQANDRKDDVVTFEELGVDMMFVDESDLYKNLFLYTKMRNVAGLSTADAQKSSDMFAKCRYLDEITGGRGIVFATGTPISNSMTEMYSIQRYLQYDRLQEMGMGQFDSWASRFGETVTALELAPEGTGYRARTRFAKFFNLPELMNIFKEVADIKTADQLNLPTPEVEYHNIVSEPTECQQRMVKELSKRAEKVHNGIDPHIDNMLRITSDGRKLGLDQRIINPMLPDESGTKVNKCVANILKIWKEGDSEKLTQLVFCDIATPSGKSNDDSEGALFTNIYDDIRKKLIAGGMKPEQVAFIHNAKTDIQKKELFAKVRSGQVRVLIGSTAKMGAGTNCQDRLIALHDLDCPWRPRDLIQRKGRIERRGNLNPKVHVYRYVTQNTFDAYLWQTVENKQKFISQIMTSKSPVRSCEDVDEATLSFAEIKALCAGDPRIKERMDLDVEVSRLKIMKADFQSKLYRLQDNVLKNFPEQIQEAQVFITGLQADIQTLNQHPRPEEGFAGMDILGMTYTDKAEAGTALLDAIQDVTGEEPVSVGSYRGFGLSVKFTGFTHKLSIRGAVAYNVEMGTDARGNLTRIDNALDKIHERLEEYETTLANLLQQQEAAKLEINKPFEYEEELRIKSARLAELDAELNIGGTSQPETAA
ncbi:MAG: DEAD/DEAH box helicase family protein [Hungatella sp.]|nr:DEAD/DEAH box helicase family protein [Lachnospiraceae bacterium]MCI9147121.1 DEAD/DEAH box helicase family protein [Hungatella sp.]